ncbi:MAG: DedA family protein [Dysgonamonadaceae bacterium]|jgi:membrane protein YqaA with SNARE-associated domain|nr:DedA family protein [Dysgonamonadaceae bacterium]
MEYLLTWGYLGLFLGSFLAATILPFSSEILVTGMLLAKASPIYVLIVATLGNWLGSLSTYGIGWLGKWEWIEKWFKTSREKIEKQQKKITKYGSFLAFFVWLPIIGDVFALALGFYKVNFIKCSTFMLIGKFLRFLIYIMLFNYVGSWFGFEI